MPMDIWNYLLLALAFCLFLLTCVSVHCWIGNCQSCNYKDLLPFTSTAARGSILVDSVYGPHKTIVRQRSSSIEEKKQNRRQEPERKIVQSHHNPVCEEIELDTLNQIAKYSKPCPTCGSAKSHISLNNLDNTFNQRENSETVESGTGDNSSLTSTGKKRARSNNYSSFIY